MSASEIASSDALIEAIEGDLLQLCGDDQALFFVLRRRVWTRLMQSEGGATLSRRKLQGAKYAEQGGCCARCGRPMHRDEAELHRDDPLVGFTMGNIRLVHGACRDA